VFSATTWAVALAGMAVAPDRGGGSSLPPHPPGATVALPTGALVPLAATSLVRVWSFAHHRWVAGDPGHEVFPCPTMIFTSAGSWQVASTLGRGTASPAAVVLGNRGQEYRCRHEEGFADRNLVLELRQGDRPFPVGLAPVDETMHRLLRQLRRALAPPAPDPLATDTAAVQLQEHAATLAAPPRHPWAAPGPDAGDRVRAVRDHIERHFADPELSLAVLAGVAGWSPSHLVRAFRAVTGQSPHRHLLQRRLDEACRLLDLGQQAVTEVCWQAGFGSLSHFVTTFRRETGLSPGAWRGRSGSNFPQASRRPPG
jgi:AraC-like DNA-binding protein